MSKKNQNYKNHIRLVPGYHYFTYTLLILIFAAAALIAAKGKMPFMGGVFGLTGLALVMITFYARYFALKAQDRAIRAEENFRYFILTGKPLSKNLRLSQIIALRFAPDDEFIALADRAEKENLPSKEIKKAIKNWRGDYHRV